MNGTLKRIGIIFAALIPVAIVGSFVFKPKEAQTPVTTATTTSQVAAVDTRQNVKDADSDDDAEEQVPANTVSNRQEEAKKEDAADVEPVFLFQDGSYTAVGGYTAPDGAQEIEVLLTVKNDVILAVAIENKAPAGSASAFWQEKFASGVSAAVVGKSLANLSLTQVSGSSLTPIGFNAALEKIRVSAKG